MEKEKYYIECVAEKRNGGASERTREWANDWMNKRCIYSVVDVFVACFLAMSRSRQHDEPKFEESHSSEDKLLGYNKRVKYNWLHLSNELGISHECEQSHSEYDTCSTRSKWDREKKKLEKE